MSKTSTFGYSNVTENTTTIKPIDLKVVTNYAKVEDEADVVVLSNKTAPLDQGELITFRANALEKVSSSQIVQNPALVRNGIQYVVKVEEILRTVDSVTGNIVDEPVVAYLTIRHQSSGNITPAIVTETVKRCLGACMRTDGTWRFDDLMRSALNPTTN